MNNKDIMNLSNEAWQDVLEGRAEQSLPKFDIVIAKSPGTMGYRNNRGFAHLVLGETDEALADFNAGRSLSVTKSITLFVGVAHWVAGDFDHAIGDWQTEYERQVSGEATHVADAAAISCQLLLYWCAVRFQRPDLKRAMMTSIKKRSRTVRYQANWAGPIGDYVLGRATANELLTRSETVHPELTKRHLSQSHFYLGVQRYAFSEMAGFAAHLRTCISLGSPLTNEYFIALKELSSV